MIKRHFMIGFLTLVLAVSASSDGDLDPTFGIGGRVRYEDPKGYPVWNSCSAIQSDGKIIVAGSIRGDFLLARYKTDGSLDTTFGIDGIVTTDFGQGDHASELSIQSDGKIVAAGASVVTGITRNLSSDLALARYNEDGSLDTTFGVGGKVTTDFSVFDYLNALAIQSDGKIVVAGKNEEFGPASADFALVRYNRDGSLDTTFGSNGNVITDFSGLGDWANAVAIQSDGKIIVAGMTDFRGRPPWYGWYGGIVRYNNDGSLDTTFGSGGKVTTSVVETSYVNALAIQSDGRIIAAGSFRSESSFDDFGLVRYNHDGSLDPTFGTQGRVTTALNSGQDLIYAVSLQPDGKIIAAGVTHLSEYSGAAFGLARYNRDGSLDATFGIGGMVRTEAPAGFSGAYAYSLGIQSDGKIVVVGSLEADYYSALELVRYNTTGLQMVSAVHFDAAIIGIGDSWNVTLSGFNLTDRTYFDVRFRSPGSTTDQVALNWQQGASGRHVVIAGTESGTWTVTGIRAHESLNDHGGEFVPVSASITVR